MPRKPKDLTYEETFLKGAIKRANARLKRGAKKYGKTSISAFINNIEAEGLVKTSTGYISLKSGSKLSQDEKELLARSIEAQVSSLSKTERDIKNRLVRAKVAKSKNKVTNEQIANEIKQKALFNERIKKILDDFYEDVIKKMSYSKGKIENILTGRIGDDIIEISNIYDELQVAVTTEIGKNRTFEEMNKLLDRVEKFTSAFNHYLETDEWNWEE